MSTAFHVAGRYICQARPDCPALALYEQWLERWGADHPTAKSLVASARIYRRIATLRRAGDTWSEIGRCCGLSSGAAKRSWERLPENLR